VLFWAFILAAECSPQRYPSPNPGDLKIRYFKGTLHMLI